MQMCLCLIVSAGIHTVRVCARLSLCEYSVFVNVCTCEMARREKESERECVSMQIEKASSLRLCSLAESVGQAIAARCD